MFASVLPESQHFDCEVYKPSTRSDFYTFAAMICHNSILPQVILLSLFEKLVRFAAGG